MRAVWWASAVLALAGCTTTKNVRVDELFKSGSFSGLSRAAFELKCPEADLSVTTLSTQKSRDYRLMSDQQAFPVKGDTVGVAGCGREAIYVYGGAVGWVNNTGAERSAK